MQFFRASRDALPLLRYLTALWPLPLLFVTVQILMRENGNSALLGLPQWLSILDMAVFLLLFAAAAVWVYWPMIMITRRGRRRAGKGRMLETAMAHLPLRSLQAFVAAGLAYATYLLLAVLGIAASNGAAILTPRTIASLVTSAYFGMAVLAPVLAFAITIRHELALRLANGTGPTLQMRELHSLHYFTDSSRRPWLVFLVTGLIPTSLLAAHAWMAAVASDPVEQRFIALQGLTLFVIQILAGTYLVFLVSRTLKVVISQLARGLEFMRRGHFAGRVPVLIDDDLGELARGLNTALQGLQEREDLKDSFKIAVEIQQALLPESLPQIPGYVFRAFEESCYAVGGDFYDFIPLADGRLWIVVADVSGKGYPAALTVANLQAMLHVLAAENVRFDAAVDYINKALCRTLAGGRFVTLFMAKLQPLSHSMLWLNAGHVPALLRTAGGIQRLNASTPPLGMLPEIRIHTQRLDLQPGDLLLVYTDGVTEMHNTRGTEMFGEERLIHWLDKHRDVPVEELPEEILQTLNRFSRFRRSEGAGSGREDDLTLLCLQREEA